jgi:hypothetical protein
MLGAAVAAAPAHAQDVKIGLMAAISGPIAALAPPMAAASKLAVTHVNEQGGILKGGKLEAVLGDSACNPQNATDVGHQGGQHRPCARHRRSRLLGRGARDSANSVDDSRLAC